MSEVPSRPKSGRRMRLLAVAGLAAVIAVSVVVATSGGAGRASAAGNGVPSWLPKSAQQYYPGYQYFSRLQKHPYASYKAPKAPWTFCYNTAFLGNAFQQGVVKELQRLVAQYKKAGLAKGSLQVTNSNFNPALELSQLNSLVQKGCNVVFGLPASPTALCSGVKNLNRHGGLYISVDSPLYCDDAINVSWNGYWAEKVGADAVVKAMGRKGNLVQTTGIAGAASAVAEVQAVKDAVAGTQVKILGQVNGQWTPSVAHTEMAKFLATHPQKVDGIIDAGAEGVGAEQALLQAGRPAAKVNSITTECAALAFWKQHPEALTLGTSQDPAAATYEAFLVAGKMLAGQKPIASTIFYPVPTITKANFAKWYKPSMTTQSGCIPSGPGVKAVADSYFNPFFSGGKQPKVALKP